MEGKFEILVIPFDNKSPVRSELRTPGTEQSVLDEVMSDAKSFGYLTGYDSYNRLTAVPYHAIIKVQVRKIA